MIRLLPLLLLACAGPERLQATPSQRAVVEALSARHGMDCARVAAVSADPGAELVWVAENWKDPGWVAVRAAECLADVDPTAWEAAAPRWTANPDLAGLAEVVADRRAP